MNPLYAMIYICVFGTACHLSCGTILTAVEGEDVQLKCKAFELAATPPCSDADVEFEWLANESTIVKCTQTFSYYTAVLNETSGALTIPHVSGSLNGTKFHCQLLKGAGTNNYKIELIVFNGTDITETTSVLSGILGGGIALECYVENVPSGFPNITFKWLLGNKPLLDACTIKDSTNAGRYNYHHDNHGCNLTINSLELTDEGRYRCEVQYSATTVWKNTSLTVNVPPRDVYIINATTGEICSGYVNVGPGIDQSFTCLATDTKPPAEITWTFAGKNTSGETRVVGTRLHNTSSTFTVPSFQPGQRRNLTCTATGAGEKVVTNIRLLGQHQETDPSMQSQMSLIFVAVGIAAALLLVLVAAIVFWKRQKNNVPYDGNQ
ncbi:T-cell surface protein tactile-like [Patiria miniata]|uniref:Ig-like domain-containing protein n=1 Tax=Patiria miniata TaxID=46514 RepID=A0A914AQ40_PATMI|nr:T-cell surface protein tactile-like [Patiria miniata]